VIIKDITGGKLKLTKAALVEVTGESIPGVKWRLTLKLLVGAENGKELRITRREGNSRMHGCARYFPQLRRIGCRTFDRKTFALILKAVKEAK
jgi:hypothetical protein